MKKAIFCTAFLWIVALSGYAQSFSVPRPKGLQCGDMPSWPISHSKKNNALPAAAASGKTTGAAASAKPVTSLPLIPLIKLWLISEPSGGKDDE